MDELVHQPCDPFQLTVLGLLQIQPRAERQSPHDVEQEQTMATLDYYGTRYYETHYQAEHYLNVHALRKLDGTTMPNPLHSLPTALPVVVIHQPKCRHVLVSSWDYFEHQRQKPPASECDRRQGQPR